MDRHRADKENGYKEDAACLDTIQRLPPVRRPIGVSL